MVRSASAVGGGEQLGGADRHAATLSRTAPREPVERRRTGSSSRPPRPGGRRPAASTRTAARAATDRPACCSTSTPSRTPDDQQPRRHVDASPPAAPGPATAARRDGARSTQPAGPRVHLVRRRRARLGAAQVALQRRARRRPRRPRRARVPRRPAAPRRRRPRASAPRPQRVPQRAGEDDRDDVDVRGAACRPYPAPGASRSSASRSSGPSDPSVGRQHDPLVEARSRRGRRAARPPASAPNSSAVSSAHPTPSAQPPTTSDRKWTPSHMPGQPDQQHQGDAGRERPVRRARAASSGQARTSATVTSVAMPEECPLG